MNDPNSESIEAGDMVDALRDQVAARSFELAVQTAKVKKTQRERDEALAQVANRDEKIVSLMATLAQSEQRAADAHAAASESTGPR